MILYIISIIISIKFYSPTPKFEEALIHWNQKVGKSQQMLPMHMIHEYCNYTDFGSQSDFENPNRISIWQLKAQEWQMFCLLSKTEPEIMQYYRGSDFNVRSSRNTPQFTEYMKECAAIDMQACTELLTIRKRQRDELFEKYTENYGFELL